MKKQVVHILVAGRALCGLPGIPRDWPDGHMWVHAEGVKQATCRSCKKANKDRK